MDEDFFAKHAHVFVLTDMSGRHRYGYVLWHSEPISENELSAAADISFDNTSPNIFRPTRYYVPIACVIVSHYPLHQAFLSALRVWYRCLGAEPKISNASVRRITFYCTLYIGICIIFSIRYTNTRRWSK